MKRKLQEPSLRCQPALRKQKLAKIPGVLANRRRRPALGRRRTMGQPLIPQHVHQPEYGGPKLEAATHRQKVELQQTRDELEVTLEKYTDLYDFAPVGYFTLNTTIQP